MLRLPIYHKNEMLLAFEFGLVMSEVAHERGLKLTPEVSKRLEQIIIDELRLKNWKQVAIEMVPNVLASFEVK